MYLYIYLNIYKLYFPIVIYQIVALPSDSALSSFPSIHQTDWQNGLNRLEHCTKHFELDCKVIMSIWEVSPKVENANLQI